MKSIITATLTLMVSSFISIAGEKSEVMIEKNGFAATNAAGRKEEVKIKMQRGIFNKTEVSLDEKIDALKSKLAFYELLKSHKIDPSKEIKVKYRNKLLTEALKELLPNVPVKFEGVKEDVTIGKLTANEASLEKVCEYLDNATGVYFRFSKEGLFVIPAAKKQE